jgi:hypothetical protein
MATLRQVEQTRRSESAAAAVRTLPLPSLRTRLRPTWVGPCRCFRCASVRTIEWLLGALSDALLARSDKQRVAARARHFPLPPEPAA